MADRRITPFVPQGVPPINTIYFLTIFYRMTASAVFFDRDGVLIEDRGLLTRAQDIRIVDRAPEALNRLRAAGLKLIVVSNQAVVARGLITEQQLEEINSEMCRRFQAAGAPPLDAIYSCPHHPEATLPAYRVACDCRKPRPGALLRAAREHGLNLAGSFLIGDRMTDIIAGSRAGCRTVLVVTPATSEPPIVTAEPLDESVQPDYICADLKAAADWIIQQLDMRIRQ
jgi:D-glycero-D-manno-heptose 1,7-bisphosphate phosphatase